MSIFDWLKGKPKSADEQRYEALRVEVEAWEDEDYDENDLRNEEMSRKQSEQVELYYKLHSHEAKKGGWGR